jgi:hypothetical protein
MLRIHRIFLTLVLMLAAIPVVRLCAWKGVGEIGPMIQRAAPAETVAGGIVTVTGFQLDSKHVRELYLSSREAGADARYQEVRYQADILTQTDFEISFRVPANVPAGDVCIALKLAAHTELVEQLVFLKIVEPVS